ncbi:unnamed protein product [Sphagnum troendelagicum]|uniref:3-hydroxyacyl-CoA dehydrogenase n=1 Tax=Sphagnum troendelagicum TaxID=128251 RepID=A0ABP0TRX5_9BRYO
MERVVTMEVGDDGVALVTLNKPPVNSLDNSSPNSLMAQLKEMITEAHSRPDVKAIVIQGANGKFSGGADIGSLQSVKKEGQSTTYPHYIRGSSFFNHIIEEGPKPVVAAIDGFALGGGLELAMASNARVAVPKAQLGLPELTLGIIPGLGGTARLPRLVGLKMAIDMMLSSKPISSEDAKEAGLIDAVASPEELVPVARRWALDIVSGKHPWRRSLALTDRLGSKEESVGLINQARAMAKKSYRNVPHPFSMLDAVEEGITNGGHAGTLKEESISPLLVVSPTAKGLMHIFFAQRSVTDKGSKAHTVKKVAVIGGGLMGSGIATALILSGVKVYLKEINSEFLQAGIQRIEENLKGRVAKGGMTQAKLQKTLGLVKGILDYEDFNDVDIVIEAAVEDISLKQRIFADLEKYCKPTCLLASNTSTIDIGVIGANTKSQDRIIGAHFFSPAHVMPLLEIVRAEQTSSQAIQDLIGLAKVIRKVPIVVQSCVGFAVNRIFFPYFQAAGLLVDLGLHPYRIDAIIKDFGMPMGPFRQFLLADLSGIQIASATSKMYKEAYPERVYLSALSDLLLKDNRLGEKTQKGYYIYKGSRKEQPAPELEGYLAESRRIAGFIPDGKAITLTDEEIVEMIFYPVVNEASRALEENVVVRSSDLDIASVLGMGFPAYRGGVVFWGDSVGLEHIYSKLNQWSSQYGPFFKPSGPLQRAVHGKYQLAQIVGQSRAGSRL